MTGERKPLVSPAPDGGEFSTILEGNSAWTVWFDKDGNTVSEERTVFGIHSLHLAHITKMKEAQA